MGNSYSNWILVGYGKLNKISNLHQNFRSSWLQSASGDCSVQTVQEASSQHCHLRCSVWHYSHPKASDSRQGHARSRNLRCQSKGFLLHWSLDFREVSNNQLFIQVNSLLASIGAKKHQKHLKKSQNVVNKITSLLLKCRLRLSGSLLLLGMWKMLLIRNT